MSSKRAWSLEEYACWRGTPLWPFLQDISDHSRASLGKWINARRQPPLDAMNDAERYLHVVVRSVLELLQKTMRKQYGKTWNERVWVQVDAPNQGLLSYQGPRSHWREPLQLSDAVCIPGVPEKIQKYVRDAYRVRDLGHFSIPNDGRKAKPNNVVPIRRQA